MHLGKELQGCCYGSKSRPNFSTRQGQTSKQTIHGGRNST